MLSFLPLRSCIYFLWLFYFYKKLISLFLIPSNHYISIAKKIFNTVDNLWARNLYTGNKYFIHIGLDFEKRGFYNKALTILANRRNTFRIHWVIEHKIRHQVCFIQHNLIKKSEFDGFFFKKSTNTNFQSLPLQISRNISTQTKNNNCLL